MIYKYGDFVKLLQMVHTEVITTGTATTRAGLGF